MNRRLSLHRGATCVVMLCLFCCCGCLDEHDKETAVTNEPAAVRSDQLSIAPAVQATIGLQVETVSARPVHATLFRTGWLRPVPGSEVTIKSPLDGFIEFADQRPPAMGAKVSRGQPLACVRALLSPQDQASLVADKEEVDTIVRQARATRDLAEQHLLQISENASSAVAGTRLSELKEQIARAEAAEQEALERLPFLPAEPYRDGLQLKPILIDTPITGRLTQLDIAPDQFVLHGEALWTVADWSRLWLRVPVYRGDLPRIDRDQPALVEVPGTDIQIAAPPSIAPRRTDPANQTIDLLFELDNTENKLRPGDSVSVWLPIETTSPTLVAARSAILWDGLGGSWVYVRTSPTTFRRQRVELGNPDGERVVIERGLREGEQVVVKGAELLFGKEFQWQIPAEDDD